MQRRHPCSAELARRPWRPPNYREPRYSTGVLAPHPRRVPAGAEAVGDRVLEAEREAGLDAVVGGQEGCWAPASPAKAAIACSGSTLATARMAPGRPSEPAMRSMGEAPTAGGGRRPRARPGAARGRRWSPSCPGPAGRAAPPPGCRAGRSGGSGRRGRQVAGGLGDRVVVGAGVVVAAGRGPGRRRRRPRGRRGSGRRPAWPMARRCRRSPAPRRDGPAGLGQQGDPPRR